MTGGRDNIAQIPVLEVLIAFSPDFFALDIDLNPPLARSEGRILQSAETGLAHDAFEHHASGNFYLKVQAL